MVTHCEATWSTVSLPSCLNMKKILMDRWGFRPEFFQIHLETPIWMFCLFVCFWIWILSSCINQHPLWGNRRELQNKTKQSRELLPAGKQQRLQCGMKKNAKSAFLQSELEHSYCYMSPILTVISSITIQLPFVRCTTFTLRHSYFHQKNRRSMTGRSNMQSKSFIAAHYTCSGVRVNLTEVVSAHHAMQQVTNTDRVTTADKWSVWMNYVRDAGNI